MLVNSISTQDHATEMLEEARNIVERHFYQLRDEELDADQLFEMRIALQDVCDTIRLATRHIEKLQREAE